MLREWNVPFRAGEELPSVELLTAPTAEIGLELIRAQRLESTRMVSFLAIFAAFRRTAAICAVLRRQQAENAGMALAYAWH